MKALNTNRFVLFSCITLFALLTGCNSSGPKTISYSDYGIPIEMLTPGNAEVINQYKEPLLPGEIKLYQVDITDNEQYGVYISMYDQETPRNISDVLTDDLDFENQFASSNKKDFEVIKQDENGYIYKTNTGYDFYWYLLKDNKLITITADTTKEKASLEDVELMYELAKSAF